LIFSFLVGNGRLGGVPARLIGMRGFLVRNSCRRPRLWCRALPTRYYAPMWISRVGLVTFLGRQQLLVDAVNRMNRMRVEFLLNPDRDGLRPPTAASHACAECPKRYAWRSNLTRHVREKHRDSERYRCAPCGKRFHRMGALRRHQAQVHLVTKAHVCPVCPSSSFSTPGHLTRHCWTEHGQRPPRGG